MKYGLLFIIFTSSLILSCNVKTTRMSVEEERWLSIFKNECLMEHFFQEYPNSEYFDTAMTLLKNILVEYFPDPPPCNLNLSAIIMTHKDSVFVDYLTMHISRLDTFLYQDWKREDRTKTFTDNTGENRKFSASYFALYPKDSIPLSQDVLIEIMSGFNMYKDSLIQSWYPNGLNRELYGTKFDRFSQDIFHFNYRKSFGREIILKSLNRKN